MRVCAQPYSGGAIIWRLSGSVLEGTWAGSAEWYAGYPFRNSLARWQTEFFALFSLNSCLFLFSPALFSGQYRLFCVCFVGTFFRLLLRVPEQSWVLLFDFVSTHQYVWHICVSFVFVQGADYLAYSIIDTIIDGYYPGKWETYRFVYVLFYCCIRLLLCGTLLFMSQLCVCLCNCSSFPSYQ